jgi:hypothetical protein
MLRDIRLSILGEDLNKALRNSLCPLSTAWDLLIRDREGYARLVQNNNHFDIIK